MSASIKGRVSFDELEPAEGGYEFSSHTAHRNTKYEEISTLTMGHRILQQFKLLKSMIKV